MQQPTLTNVRVRTTRDALLVFYAVARRALPMITRRLDAEERRAIAPGNVYIWEERCANAEVTGLGMERWTDGISWSASRIAQEFLFYRQRDADQDAAHPSAQWANIIKRRDPRFGTPASPRTEADRLIKQTYSVHVSLPEDRARGLTRKWHLTAYFSQATLDALRTVDALPGVGDAAVPAGWFRNARASKAKPAPGPGPGAHDEHGAPYREHDAWAPDPDRYPEHPPHAYAQPAPYHAHAPVSYPAHAPPDPARAFFRERRDASPCTQSSSSSSEPGADASPRPFSAPLTPPFAAQACASTPPPFSPLPSSSSFSPPSSSSFSPPSASFSSPPSSFAIATPPYAHPQPPPTHAGAASRDLVPLAFLKTLQPPARDAIAEDCLRRLSGARIAPAPVPAPR